MRDNEVEVKMRKGSPPKTVIVDAVNVPIYENMDEIEETFTEAEILALINSQNRSNITNKARASHREKAAGKGKRYEIAYNCLVTVVFNDGKTGMDKLNETIKADNPKEALDALLNSPEVQAAVDERLADEGGEESEE